MKIEFPYPLQSISTPQGISLQIPVPDQVQATYEHLRKTHPKTPFPYWARIWPSALALAEYLINHPETISGKTLLELGAGTGLPSFTIAKRASSIIITDHNEDAVQLIRENIASLGLQNATAMLLDWNLFPEELCPDLILMSDVNYEPDQFNALLKLIGQLLEKNISIIIATPQRISAVAFVQKLQAFLSGSFVQGIEEGNTKTDISIYLLSRA